MKQLTAGDDEPSRTGSERCKAKNRRGERCREPVVQGMEVCRFHGGLSLRGRASATYRHGRRSKYVPERYRDAYEAALSDPELANLRPQIAVLEAREGELLERLSTAESGAAWSAAASALSSLRSALRENDRQRMAAALADLDRTVNVGLGDERAWGEIRDNMESRRRLVDTERRRLEAAGAYMTADEVLGIADLIVAAIREEIADPVAVRAVVQRIRGIVAPPRRELPAEGEDGAEEGMDGPEEGASDDA